MKLINQRPIKFINKYKVKFDHKLLESAMLWYSDKVYGKPVISIKKIYISDIYPLVTINNGTVYLHRLICSYHHKRVLGSKEYVHHKDGDKKNSNLENLQLMSASEHQSLTNKGKKQSKEHVTKRIASMRKTRYGY